MKHGLVLVGTGEGKLLGLSLQDGSISWQDQYNSPFESTILVQGDTSFVSSRSGELLAITTATGEKIWSATLSSESRTPVWMAQEKLIVQTADNKVTALARETGQVIWSKGRSAPRGLTLIGHAGPLVYQGKVYAAYSDGYVECYRLQDGELVWSRMLSNKGGQFVDADASPLIVGDQLYVSSFSDGVYALKPQDGTTNWHRNNLPQCTALAEFSTHIITAHTRGVVVAVDQQTGKTVWQTRIPNSVTSALVVHKNVIVFSGGEVGLVVLDAKTGKPLQATSLGANLNSPPVWQDKYLALVSSDGFLNIFEEGFAGRVQ